MNVIAPPDPNAPQALRTSPAVTPPPAAPPPTGGTNTPGGTGAAQAPPVPGAISDPNRTKAFNPETERGVGAVDASGRDIRGQAGPPAGAGAPGAPSIPFSGGYMGNTPGLSSNNAVADYAASVGGAHQGAVQAINSGQYTKEQIQAGAGAASPRATNAILQRYNGNGRLTPGEAIVAGMTAVYEKALQFGDMAKANAMSFAIVQRANLEAAQNGRAAAAAMQAGDADAAKKYMVRGLDWIPDATRTNLSPDGQSLIVTDVHGKTQQVPIDGRMVLAASMGLQNGTLMWNFINQHAAMYAQSMKGQDRDATGRQLRNQKTLLEIERIRRKLAGGGQAVKAGPAGGFIENINHLVNGTTPPAPPQQVHVTVDREDD
jgi:hypothetical protein